MKDINVTFPGGQRVDAHYDNRTVKTDQSVKNGGEGSAPEPFDLFFVSMATCAGSCVLDFCIEQELNTEGLCVRLRAERDAGKKLFTPIRIEVTLPHDFPENYRAAILETAKLCTVTKHVVNSPECEIILVSKH